MNERMRTTVMDRIRAAGLRVTRQRLAVVETLHDLGGHHTADEVHAQLARNDVTLPRTSVYNALTALSVAGVIFSADVGPGPVVYELADRWHHHFVCRRCGEVRDVSCVIGAKPCLTPREDVGQVDEAQVIFRGICGRCLEGAADAGERTGGRWRTRGRGTALSPADILRFTVLPHVRRMRPAAIPVRLWSLRGRISVLVAVVSVLLLVPMGVAEGTLQHRAFADSVWLGAQRQAELTAAEIRVGGLNRAAVAPRVPGITLIQVVGRGHRVIAASAGARGMAAMSKVWPSPQDPQVDVQANTGPHHERLRVSAARVLYTSGSPVVYAAEPDGSPPPEVSDLLVALQAALLIGLAVWAA
jgi:Fe2+ or Zn2+ uptake regulation protein